ncbi:MAG: orotidine 5'-phosphate decarboxylase [Nanoarchaeota archaeon]|nr:orotidine 5'-phosphate decarboxylase [Nanoarchaeota archaeon]
MSLLEEWLTAVDKKNSVLCGGLDPAEFAMGRTEKGKGLPEGTDKLQWSLDYVEALSRWSAGIKLNINYWKDAVGMADLKTLADAIHSEGMVAFTDEKIPDIGATNDAGVFYAAQKGFDAVTYVPFPGNIAEVAEQGRKRGIGIIQMVLMSSPEFEREKLNWAPTRDGDNYHKADITIISGQDHVHKYIQLAHDAKKHGIEGVVIGAPNVMARDAEGNPTRVHPTKDELQRVRSYVGSDMVVLLPAVGEQGGQANDIWQYFGKDRVIVNVGRAVMFPNGANSTPKEQAAKAQQYCKMLNELRA